MLRAIGMIFACAGHARAYSSSCRYSCRSGTSFRLGALRGLERRGDPAQVVRDVGHVRLGVPEEFQRLPRLLRVSGVPVHGIHHHVLECGGRRPVARQIVGHRHRDGVKFLAGGLLLDHDAPPGPLDAHRRLVSGEEVVHFRDRVGEEAGRDGVVHLVHVREEPQRRHSPRIVERAIFVVSALMTSTPAFRKNGIRR